MNHQSFWYVIPLLIFRIFSPSIFINAETLELNPTANSSSSWINYPSELVYVNSTEGLNPSFSLILYRGSSSGSRFMCGFSCQNSSETAITSCLFGVFIFQSSFGFKEDSYLLIINEPKLVWSANRDHPVKINASLNFANNGEIILKDSDGTFIWSTNTSARNITARLVLTETGNLLVQGKENEIVWQSFDHPTDTLVPSQKLIWGQSLSSSMSTTDFRRGLFSIVFQNNILSAYIKSNPIQNYFLVDPSAKEQYFKVRNDSLIFIEPIGSTAARFMRLDSDGHLKVYVWDVSGWNAVSDLFAEDIGECGYPLVCGKYGICSNGQCSCPDEANNETTAFKPINNRQPNLGCASATPISCDNSKSHTLFELKNTSYLNLDQWYASSTKPRKEGIKLEDCKNSCLRDCSCKAAFYAYDMLYDTSDSNAPSYYNQCFLVSEVYSMTNTKGYGDVLAFLKVEESLNKLNSPSTASPPKRSSRIQIIAGCSIGASLGVISLSALFLILRKKKIEEFDDLSFNQVPWMPTRFSYEDLKSITNNFLTKLGQGGFGTVFEGTLSDGTKVAVKRLDGLRHIKKSFLAEVETIGSIHHINLVSLIGFCAEKSHGLLVYEYMPKGSLDKWIFRTNGELSLDWEPRKKIILDIAKGLAYLHEGCRCKIFHLDIKPQNILLDENLNAKVSDFGLAKLIDKDQSRVMTTLKGTPGYLAPEWLSSIITEKVDVYSFGIVVLEILCGRKNVDMTKPEEDMHLLSLFSKKTEEGRPEDLVNMCDEEMQKNVGEIVKMMKIAKWCIQSNYSLRPSMTIVVNAIEHSLDVENDLRYDFANLSTSNITPEEAFGGATLLLPITLSGPR